MSQPPAAVRLQQRASARAAAVAQQERRAPAGPTLAQQHALSAWEELPLAGKRVLVTGVAST